MHPSSSATNHRRRAGRAAWHVHPGWSTLGLLALVGACQAPPSLLSEEEYTALSAGPDGDACRESGDCACGPDARFPGCPASACYAATCEATVCVYRAVDGCERCDTVADCRQGDACTVDACEDGVCVYPEDPCDDGVTCTGTSCDPVEGCLYEDVCLPPSVTVTASATAVEGAPWRLTGSFTGAPEETFEATVVWDVAAGGDPEVLPLTDGTFNAPHAFDDNGTYTVRLVIGDGAGRSTPKDVTVAVDNADPTLTTESATASGDEGADIVIHGHVADALGDTVTLISNCGDGEAGVLQREESGDFTLTHAWRQDSKYTVTLTATDEDGGETQRVVTVTVKDVLPTLSGPSQFNISEGTALVKTFEVDDPGDLDLFTWTVDYGEGAETAPVAVDPDADSFDVTFLYPNGPAEKDVVVHLYEGAREVATRPVDVSVKNVTPVLTAIGDQSGAEGAALTFSLPLTDPGAETFTVSVAWGDGMSNLVEAVDQGDGAWTVPLSHTYVDDGTFNVSITVSDDGGSPQGLQLDAIIANVAPYADLPAALAPIDEGGTFTYHGTAVEPGVDFILGATVTWTVAGEDTLETVAIAQDKGYTLRRAFAQDGEVTVRVDMHDDQDASSETRTLAVRNVLPHDLDCPGPLSLPEAAPFDRGCTFVDPGADPVTVTVDYDDGSDPVVVALDASTRGFAMSHAWDVAGPYTVTVTLNDGGGDAVFELPVQVGNAAPGVVLDDDAPASVEGATLTVSGAVVDATLGDAFTATVDWGDGGGPVALPILDRAFTASHVYRDDGDYALKIVVVDASDAQGQLQRTVPVGNLDPTVDSGEAVSLFEGGRLSRVVTLSDAGLDDVLTASVDYKEGAQATPINVTDRKITLDNVYEAEGSYLVTLFVSDGDGGSASVDLPVEVANVAPTISFATGPTTVAEGATFTRALTFVDPGGDELSVTVDWGDGSDPDPAIATITSAQVSHVFADDGVYTLVVSAFDGTDTAEEELTVTVTNALPIIVWGSNDAATEGAAWQHTVQVSDPGSADTFTGRVRWSAGGAFEPLAIPAAGDLVLTHTFPLHGTYQVTVEVTDDDQGKQTASAAVDVADVAPVILVPDERGPIPEGTQWLTTTTFTDPGAEAQWGGCIDYDDGDGCKAKVWGASRKIELKNRWFDEGTYQVEIRVLTSPPAFVSRSFDVEVVNVPPEIHPPAESPSLALSTVLDGTITVDDPGDDDVTLVFDLGDGSPPREVALGLARSLDLTTLGHSYDETGLFTVTVDADDGDGGTHRATFPVVVGNSPPVIAAPSPILSAVENTEWHGQASFTDPDNEDHWDAYVDFGDGTAPVFVAPDVNKKINLAHTFTQDGTYDVALSVTDTAPQTRTVHFSVVITNAAPTVALGSETYMANEGANASVSGTAGDPNPHDALTVRLDWGDGTALTQLNATGGSYGTTHAYAESGDYTITATVDDGTDTATTTATAHVANVAPTVQAWSATSVDYAAEKAYTLTWTDPGADSWTWSIDWADGSDPTTGAATERTVQVPHTFLGDQLGDHVLTITVTDDDGDSGQRSATVTVKNPKPVMGIAAPTAVTVAQGEEVAVVVPFVDPHPAPGEPHVALVWWTDDQGGAFCDDRNAQPVNGSCQTTGKPAGSSLVVDEGARTLTARAPYLRTGAFHLQLGLRDSAGGYAAPDCAQHLGCVDVTVTNVAPVVGEGVDVVADLDGDLTLETSLAVDDPGDETWSATVDWGDGDSGQVAVMGGPGAYTLPLDHSYDAPGIYLLTVSVDDGGGAVERTLEARVQANTCDGYAGIAWDRVWMGLGADPGDWHDPDNWWPVGVPGPSDAVALCAHGTQPADKTVTLGQDAEVRAIGAATTVSIDATAPVTLTVNGDLQLYGTLGGVGAGSELVLTGADATLRLTRNTWGMRVTGDVALRTLPGSSYSESRFDGAVDLTAGKLRISGFNGKRQRFYGDLTSAVSEDGATGLALDADADLQAYGALRFTANPGAVTASSLADLSGGSISLQRFEGSAGALIQERPTGLTGATFATGGTFELRPYGGTSVRMDSPGAGTDASCIRQITLVELEPVIVDSDICVGGIRSYDRNRLVPSAPGRTVILADGAQLNVGLGGGDYAVDLGDMDLVLAGRADVAATLTTTGALTVPAGGSLGIRSGDVHVGAASFASDDVATACSAEAAQSCVLEQRSPTSVLDVAGDLSFSGPRADYPLAYLSRGLVTVGGDLTIAGAYVSLSGSHVLELDAPAGTVQRADVGDLGQPAPANLRLTGGGTLDLEGGALAVSGTLSSDGPSRYRVSDGAVSVGGLDASGLVFDDATLTLTGAITRMDDIVFTATDPTADAFTIESEAPGQAATRLQLHVVPTTGAYLRATTASSAGLTITGSAPAYGTPYVVADPGFTVTWGSPLSDGDGDGLSDGAEQASGTNPGRIDSDGDGVGDGVEVALATNPVDAGSAPFAVAPPEPYGFSGAGAVALAVADVTGGPGADLVVAEASTASVYLFEDLGAGGPSGVFDAPVALAVGSAPTGVTAGLGAIYAALASEGVARWEDAGASWSETAAVTLAGSAPGPVATWSPGGVAEVLVASGASPGEVRRLPPDLADAGTALTSASLGGTTRLVVGALHGAAAESFAALNAATGTLTVYWDDAGAVTAGPTLTLSAPVTALGRGSVYGGGLDDLVVAEAADGGARITLYAQGAGGAFTADWVGALPFDVVTGLAVADLDGDGRQDLVGAVPGRDALVVFLQLPSGEFLPSELPAAPGARPIDVAPLDLGDPTPCLVTLDAGASAVAVWCLE